MPNLPLVNPPESFASGVANTAKESPVLASPTRMPTIRANPGMYDAVGAAGARLGDSVAGLGELAFRIKSTTDSAFITRSQTQMEAANADFHNWTKTNPDPSTWDDELNARISETKTAIAEGSKTLSPFAKVRLGLTLNEWETRTRKTAQLQATDQSLNIANASYTEFIAQATSNNDMPAVAAKVQEGVAHGVFHPKTGQIIMEKAQRQITANFANMMIDADPFEGYRQLRAKDEQGNYLNFTDLNATERMALVYHANQVSNETRAHTTQEWRQNVADAEAGIGPMPDRAAIEKESAHQGIDPKFVSKLFATPGPVDGDALARAYETINTYDPSNDPHGEGWAAMMMLAGSFKGPNGTSLIEMLKDKRKEPARVEKPIEMETIARLRKDYEEGYTLPSTMEDQKIPGTGVLGFFAKTKSEMAPPSEEKRKNWRATATKEERDAADLHYTHQLSLLRDWFKQNPGATPEKAEEYRQTLSQPYVLAAVQHAIANPPAAAADQPNVTQEQYAKLKTGELYWWNGKQIPKK